MTTPQPLVTLLLAFHNHQPVGNFDNVFQEALDKCYDPFLSFLEEHPRFRVTLHYSGCLLDWLDAHKPSFLNRLSKIVARGQVELMGGGYYEPILTLIPEQDAIGQLQKMNAYLKKRFGQTARGFWLSERVWEPKLPRLAGEAGLQYTATDDTHFSMAGLPQDEIRDFYVTEEEGQILTVFPILKELRYLIPFREPHETLEALKRRSDGKETVITFADDGEKFGLWPGTYQWVYRDGWLERFAEALEDNKSWIRLKTFSEVLDEKKPRGTVYIPTASYEEMMEWSLSLKKGRAFGDLRRRLENSGLWQEAAPYLQSGYFKNFLVKYPEASHMRRRMEYTSQKVHQIQKGPAKDKALTSLWKGECNCPYWHGVFGGLYLHHLRRSTYENLIAADEMAREANAASRPAAEELAVEEIDFNRDGTLELVTESRGLKLFLNPDRGGRIVELDLIPLKINVLDTLSRREEAYHASIKVGNASAGIAAASIHDLPRTVSSQIMERLAFDSYDRGSWLDWFFPTDFTFENYQKGKLSALAATVGEPYTSTSFTPRGCNELHPRGVKGVKKNRVPFEPILQLSRQVNLGTAEILLEKELSIDKKKPCELLLRVMLSNLSSREINFLFGQEWNFTFYEGVQKQTALKSWRVQDGWSRSHLELGSAEPFDYWQYPIETLAQTEKDFQLMHQGLCIFPHWQIALGPKKKWRSEMRFVFTDAGRPFSS